MTTGTSSGYVGQSVRRIDGAALVTGQARFVGDLAFPGLLHVAILRSPYAHARIRQVETAAAAAMPGVVAVLSGEDVRRHLDPIPHRVDPASVGGRRAEVWALAPEEVLYTGQGVAAVAAETLEQARAALARIRVVYEPLPVVLDAEEALRPDAARVVDGWPDNVLLAGRIRHGDVEGAMARAQRVVRATIRIHRYTTQPLEPRTYLAIPDPLGEGLVLYATTQNPHQLRHMLAQTLRLPEHRLRIIVPRLGGAFGLKMIGHPEESLVCLFTLLTRRPVRWVASREEELLIGGREQVHHVEVGCTAEGRIVAFRDRFVANVGAPYPTPGWGMAPLTAATLPCVYDVQDVDIAYTLVATHKGPWTASRGYGKEAATVVMERVMDLVARACGLDPVEVRLRNLIAADAFPYRTATGLVLDSGDYRALLRRALELAGYDRLREAQARLRACGRWLGVGVAMELTPEGGSLPRSLVAGYDTAAVRVAPSGAVTVLTGVTSPGTGNETAIAQLVADELGVPPETVRVVQGDTDLCPYGFGNYSGRSVIAGGTAAVLAAREVRAKMAQVAAALLGAPPDVLRFRDGRVEVDGAPAGHPPRSVAFGEVAYVAHAQAYDLAHMIEPPLEATRTYRPPTISHQPDAYGRINPYPTYSACAYVVAAEVDPETGVVLVRQVGAVHDAGVVVNPALVAGQLRGAIAMGLGGALSEEVRYAPDGTRLTTSLGDYRMLRAPDLPPIVVEHRVTPSPHTLLGVKGGGEAGVGGAAAALMNAVADALAPLGVEVLALPLRPDVLWQAMQSARHRR
jgi:carbon-monoxide dehydrogenase large subunit